MVPKNPSLTVHFVVKKAKRSRKQRSTGFRGPSPLTGRVWLDADGNVDEVMTYGRFID